MRESERMLDNTSFRIVSILPREGQASLPGLEHTHTKAHTHKDTHTQRDTHTHKRTNAHTLFSFDTEERKACTHYKTVAISHDNKVYTCVCVYIHAHTPTRSYPPLR